MPNSPKIHLNMAWSFTWVYFVGSLSIIEYGVFSDLCPEMTISVNNNPVIFKPTPGGYRYHVLCPYYVDDELVPMNKTYVYATCAYNERAGNFSWIRLIFHNCEYSPLDVMIHRFLQQVGPWWALTTYPDHLLINIIIHLYINIYIFISFPYFSSSIIGGSSCTLSKIK